MESNMDKRKYRKSLTLCIEALHTLCVGPGELRSRLWSIDKEFFSLKPEQFPDAEQLRADMELLLGSVRTLQPRNDEGLINATISRARIRHLEKVAQQIWDIHRKFAAYMNNAAS